MGLLSISTTVFRAEGKTSLQCPRKSGILLIMCVHCLCPWTNFYGSVCLNMCCPETRCSFKRICSSGLDLRLLWAVCVNLNSTRKADWSDLRIKRHERILLTSAPLSGPWSRHHIVDSYNIDLASVPAKRCFLCQLFLSQIFWNTTCDARGLQTK